MLVVGVIIYDVHKEGGCGVMKFLEILQTIVDGFWGRRCGVCVWGEGILFLIFWRSTCTESKYLFPNTCKYFPTFFSLLFHCFYTESMWKFQGSYKKKWIFQGCWRKTHVEFPRILVFDVGICKGVTQFCRFSEGKSLFSLEFLRVKW